MWTCQRQRPYFFMDLSGCCCSVYGVNAMRGVDVPNAVSLIFYGWERTAAGGDIGIYFWGVVCELTGCNRKSEVL